MAEDAVKRVTGLNSLLPIVPEIPSMVMPFVNNNNNNTSSNSSADASMTIQRDFPNNLMAAPPHDQRLNNGFPTNGGPGPKNMPPQHQPSPMQNDSRVRVGAMMPGWDSAVHSHANTEH